MRKQLRSRSVKKVQVVTPGGRTVTHFKGAKPGMPHCGNCGVKMQRRGRSSKSSKRAERRFPGLCVRCSREAVKLKPSGGTPEKLVMEG